MSQRDDTESDDALLALKAAGWSIGDTAFFTDGAGLAWLVSGTNGENVIRAEGATQKEAWARALDQAREVGMSR